MPHDFILETDYSIDIENLKRHILSFKYKLSYLKNADGFLNEWCSLILSYYQNDTIAKLKNDYDDKDIFQKSYCFEGQQVLFHFKIKAIELLAVKYCSVENISISQFTHPNSTFNFEYTEILTDYEIYKNPILIVPFPVAPYESLVIDGNHRLSARINAKKNGIYAYNIKDPLLSKIGLSSFFERAMYLFLCDLSYAFQLTDTYSQQYGFYDSKYIRLVEPGSHI